MAKVIIIGPAHPLRGGLATFNQRLAREFTAMGHDCSILSFSLQYPSIFFPGKTQYTTEAAPEGVSIRSLINSVSPLNWIKVGRMLEKEAPDIIVVRYWIPFMGPALGTILRKARKNGKTRVICIADNVIPHEHRPGDRSFTRYFIKSVDAFIAMSEPVLNDLKKFTRDQPAKLVMHPLYDNFGAAISREEARNILGLQRDEKYILFFGFIRHYKGLDILLRAMADPRIRKEGIRLIVAGEFYEEEKNYRELIRQLGIEDLLVLKTDFIPDGEVKNYLCAADAVIQPYRNATQSGVTPLAYHFERPMVVTDVGGLPSLVPHKKVGLVTRPDPKELAEAILQFYQLGENYFIAHLRNEKQKYSWSHIVQAITQLANDLPK